MLIINLQKNFISKDCILLTEFQKPTQTPQILIFFFLQNLGLVYFNLILKSNRLDTIWKIKDWIYSNSQILWKTILTTSKETLVILEFIAGILWARQTVESWAVSWLVAHPSNFRILMKVKFDAFLPWPFSKIEE